MTHKSLLAAMAAVTLLSVSSGAGAAECLRGDRTAARMSDVVHRTDRVFQRMGDAVVRTGDRMLSWFRRPRV
jgi:hypothetical protein